MIINTKINMTSLKIEKKKITPKTNDVINLLLSSPI